MAAQAPRRRRQPGRGRRRAVHVTRLPPAEWKSARTTDEMDKRFLQDEPAIRGDLLQVCSLVRPRRRRSFVPTAALAAAARRGGQGWPRLARPPQGLVLIGPSTAACLIGSGLQRPDGWPRLALSGSTGTDRRRDCCRARATSWRRAARRLQASGQGSLICALPI